MRKEREKIDDAATQCFCLLRHFNIRCSIVVSISACHAEDPGSIPGGGVYPSCLSGHSPSLDDTMKMRRKHKGELVGRTSTLGRT